MWLNSSPSESAATSFSTATAVLTFRNESFSSSRSTNPSSSSPSSPSSNVGAFTPVMVPSPGAPGTGSCSDWWKLVSMRGTVCSRYGPNSSRNTRDMTAKKM